MKPDVSECSYRRRINTNYRERVNKAMKTYIFCLLVFIFYMNISCTEKYQFPKMKGQIVVVIAGLVTNEPGPYYVTVWEDLSNISSRVKYPTVRPINDARVTITDSDGNMDELRPFLSVPVETELIETPYQSYYQDFYQIPDGEGGYVRFSYSEFGGIDSREGKYFTTSTKGQPGHTYTLKVEYEGAEYTATDYMCYGTAIDSVSVEPVGGYVYNKPDGADGFLVPCLYFAEPQNEINFYMFNYYTISTPDESYVYKQPLKNMILSGMGGEWTISMVSDRFLPPYVNKYKMDDGDHDRKWFNGTDMGFYNNGMGWLYGGTVDMYCITESVYRYYYALAQQYYQDGGAFSPSPASPPTNFSGGVQGCFSAASVSQYVLKLWE